ncbi:MAG: hypothetical protein MI924_31645 [Chloroflexales bacterium]|nr:hypothetical protein [Chloroflexales bacterium]
MMLNKEMVRLRTENDDLRTQTLQLERHPPVALAHIAELEPQSRTSSLCQAQPPLARYERTPP